MGWLKKLMGKEQSHEEWLAAHPGKESAKSAPVAVDLEEQARIRKSMEAEMTTDRDKRASP